MLCNSLVGVEYKQSVAFFNASCRRNTGHYIFSLISLVTVRAHTLTFTYPLIETDTFCTLNVM